MDALTARLNAAAGAPAARRQLEAIDSPQGREIDVAGAHFLNFSSNDYLGMSTHPAVVQAAQDAIGRHGVGSGAAALLSGRSTAHADLEKQLAAFAGVESALLYSSGYMANLGLASALLNRRDHVFHDKLNHASLLDTVALSGAKSTRYAHLDTTALERHLARSDAANRWVITDSVFSMDGDIAPVATLATVAERHGATLIVDDAHGFGVIGGGRGIAAAAQVEPSRVPIRIVTFGKALGTAGAAILGSASLIDALVQRSRTFIYDTAPPPALSVATLTALKIIENEPAILERLDRNISLFRSLATGLPLMTSSTPIQPVMIGEDGLALAVSTELRRVGFYVRAVRPPTVPKGTARLRICLSAMHREADIEALVGALRAALTRCSP